MQLPAANGGVGRVSKRHIDIKQLGHNVIEMNLKGVQHNIRPYMEASTRKLNISTFHVVRSAYVFRGVHFSSLPTNCLFFILSLWGGMKDELPEKRLRGRLVIALVAVHFQSPTMNVYGLAGHQIFSAKYSKNFTGTSKNIFSKNL